MPEGLYTLKVLWLVKGHGAPSLGPEGLLCADTCGSCFTLGHWEWVGEVRILKTWMHVVGEPL